MPPRNFGNRNPGIQCLGDDPPLLLRGPAPAASNPGAYLHPPKRQLRVAYSVGHMCKTFPLNRREACDIPRAGIKVGSENRFRYTCVYCEPYYVSINRNGVHTDKVAHVVAGLRANTI